MVAHLDERQLKQLHRQLRKKGAEINETLVKLLAGEQVQLPPLVGGRPGERPEERLHRFLNLVDAKIRATRGSGDPSYGRCESCGAPLPFVELEQMPWADTCRTCAETPPETEI